MDEEVRWTGVHTSGLHHKKSHLNWHDQRRDDGAAVRTRGENMSRGSEWHAALSPTTFRGEAWGDGTLDGGTAPLETDGWEKVTRSAPDRAQTSEVAGEKGNSAADARSLDTVLGEWLQPKQEGGAVN